MFSTRTLMAMAMELVSNILSYLMRTTSEQEWISDTAATAVGTTYGVATSANIIAIKGMCRPFFLSGCH